MAFWCNIPGQIQRSNVVNTLCPANQPDSGKQERISNASFREQRVALAVVALLGYSAMIGNCETMTVTYQVSTGGDNARASEYHQSMGYNFLRVGYWDEEAPPFTMSAMRFRDVNVPQGALVVDARLKIRAHSHRDELLYGVIHAEDADNPVGFSGRYIKDIVKTSAAVNWDHSAAWSIGKWYTSPDISGMVQEVIDRPGWSAGNTMVITYSNRLSAGGFRQFCSYEFGSQHTSGPKLEITYGELPVGDFDRDGDVDFADFAIFARSWLTVDGDALWNPDCDIYTDDSIDMLDLGVFVDNWLASI